MKMSKLLAAMVCCAMSTAAMAQHEQPKATEGLKPKVEPAKVAQPGDKKSAPTAAPGADKDAAAWQKAMEKGPMHDWLGKMAGNWDTVVKMMEPGKPVQESTGTMTSTTIMGGRFVHSMYKGTFMGMPFEGAGTMGYNNLTQKFEGTWMDNMGTGTMFMTGTLDESKSTLTMKGEFMCPVTNKMCKAREVWTVKNDNQMVAEFYNDMTGAEAKCMEITYTRAKADKGATKMGSAGDASKNTTTSAEK